ncbi:penicillin acylase family protein [Actinosynnema sp. NPDC023587]|uniref:penicillin acylase family protein n=1 Tax=Actinosynnema sp. NPDC023587 TaxID=3154695 RepID=UPI00340AC2D1
MRGFFEDRVLPVDLLTRKHGVSFAGASMYVQLGRGLDYSWSATSAGQDITDTYAVELCGPEGNPASATSQHYHHRSECQAKERIERKNAWKPTVADPTLACSYTLAVHRTRYGLVQSQAQVDGKHVAYTSLRSTYLHEVDSIVGFQEFNDPNAIRSAQDFQRAAEHVEYTFNWFYADAKDTASYTPFPQHPNSVNQDYCISWNNKQPRTRPAPLAARERRGRRGGHPAGKTWFRSPRPPHDSYE